MRDVAGAGGSVQLVVTVAPPIVIDTRSGSAGRRSRIVIQISSVAAAVKCTGVSPGDWTMVTAGPGKVPAAPCVSVRRVDSIAARDSRTVAPSVDRPLR